MRCGQEEGLPYSLSRWTDVPAAKWDWFRAQVEGGSMVAMDPKTGLPARWSLDPARTLGLIFWTRNPLRLIHDAALVHRFRKVVHFTLTGWHEVEHRAPGIDEGLELLAGAVETFGVENVTWRFSPVPAVPDVEERFERIARAAMSLGLRRVDVSFLQENDEVPEPRTRVERRDLLGRLAARVPLDVVLCRDDLETLKDSTAARVHNGVCEDGQRFSPRVRTEGCGCALAVDPFSRNEACVYGCRYCYSANRTTAPKKRNTTLPMYGVRR